jgi:hypothetical protein
MAMAQRAQSEKTATSMELRDLLLALDDGSGTGGSQRVAEMLTNADLLVDALCDSSLSREQTLRLARQALAISPGVKYKLTNALCMDAGRDESEMVRVIDVLGELFEGEIPPAIRRLRLHGGGMLRAKATLTVSRTDRSLELAEQALNDVDDRVRANAVEAIAELKNERVRALLEKAAKDPHRRVQANALLALHKLGVAEAEKMLLDLSANRSPYSRSAAAWAMGRTGDPVFGEALGWMLGDPDARVRKHAFQSIKAIKSAQAAGEPQKT